MNIAFIGSGKVGAALADRFQKQGHDVVLAAASENSPSLAKARQRNPALRVALAADAVKSAEIVVLATPFGAIQSALAPLADALAGKILIDCTNPVGPGLGHGLQSTQAGSEVVQSLVPSARVVKAFSIYGYENLEATPSAAGAIRPVMMFCGDDKDAKQRVTQLIEALDYEALDVGGLNQALHLEHLTLLWVKLVRAHGHSPRLVWSALHP